MPGSASKALHVRLAPFAITSGSNPVERLAKRIPFAQDRDPGKPRLKPVEDQLFPQRAAIPFGNAPFRVVVGDIKRIAAAPFAPSRARHRKSLQLDKNPRFQALLTAEGSESP
jgi:hypothetical protein